jgi:alpha/beta superfamily hydrolase
MPSDPTKEQTFFIPGPAGRLEVLATDIFKGSLADPPLIGVVCHPHPLFQGTMNNKVVTTIAKAWQELGVPTLRFNFRGVGESEGHYGEGAGVVQDLRAVLEWILAHQPNCRFWLGGFSFGSYISLQLAEPDLPPVVALLSVAPPVHLFDFSAIRLPTCPWVVIQGQQDTIVSYELVLKWYETVKVRLDALNHPFSLITLPNASHFFHGQLIELKALIQTAMEPLV